MAHTPRRGRWTAEQEQEAALAILGCEARALEAIRDVSQADAILHVTTKRTERTRAAAVDRLEEAVDAVWQAAQEQPELLDADRTAKQALVEAEGHRWKLAMSGRRGPVVLHVPRDLFAAAVAVPDPAPVRVATPGPPAA